MVAVISLDARERLSAESLSLKLNFLLMRTAYRPTRTSPPFFLTPHTAILEPNLSGRVFPNPVGYGNLSSSFRCHRLSLAPCVDQSFDSRYALCSAYPRVSSAPVWAASVILGMH